MCWNQSVFSPDLLDMLKMQDYEYSRAGVSDPAILITTSRDPSSKLSQFAKEVCWMLYLSLQGKNWESVTPQVKLLFPTSQRMNRGSMITKDLVEASRRNGFTDIIVLHEHRGVPGWHRGALGHWEWLFLPCTHQFTIQMEWLFPTCHTDQQLTLDLVTWSCVTISRVLVWGGGGSVGTD